MKFLYPAFLFALLTVAIPLIVHFFNFKRHKTVYFSNVGFLKAIKKDSRKISQLKHLLILASRILTIVFLVLAFSQPYIPFTNRATQKAKQAVAIYIDNSFSMRLENEGGVLMEQARIKAIEIANSYRPGTRFLLLTNDFLPQHRFLLNKEQFIALLSELKISPNTTSFRQIMVFARQQLAETGEKFDKTFYVLSDFQKNNFSFSQIKKDTTTWSYLMPFTPGKVNNIYIDSCWFETPGRKIKQAEKLFVKVINSSSESYQNIPIRLLVNDSLKAISNLNIGAEEHQTVELSFTNNSSGFQYAKIELDDYPLVYDNSFFIAYEVHGKAEVMGIFEAGDPVANNFRALFTDDEFINYEEAQVKNLQISHIKNKQCIFLVNLKSLSSGLINELAGYVKNSGTLAIFPSSKADKETFNQLLTSLNANTIISADTGKMKISNINYSDILFKNVFKRQEEEADLPEIKNFFNFSKKDNISETTIMTFRNKQPALTCHRAVNGKVYSFAFPADITNSEFMNHLIFVPSVYNIALNSITGTPLSYPIELQNLVVLSQNTTANSNDQLKIKMIGSGEEFFMQSKPKGSGMIQLDFSSFIHEAGHYQLLSESKTVEALAYNYKRDESDPRFYSTNELDSMIVSSGLKQFATIASGNQDFKETLQELNNGKQLWRHFLILALLSILTEALIIRLWGVSWRKAKKGE